MMYSKIWPHWISAKTDPCPSYCKFLYPVERIEVLLARYPLEFTEEIKVDARRILKEDDCEHLS